MRCCCSSSAVRGRRLVQRSRRDQSKRLQQSGTGVHRTKDGKSLAVHEIDVRFSCNNTIAAAAEEELKELLMIKPAPESASGT
ncbi:unnamed protein product [Sphagnum tenellum]